MIPWSDQREQASLTAPIDLTCEPTWFDWLTGIDVEAEVGIISGGPSNGPDHASILSLMVLRVRHRGSTGAHATRRGTCSDAQVTVSRTWRPTVVVLNSERAKINWLERDARSEGLPKSVCPQFASMRPVMTISHTEKEPSSFSVGKTVGRTNSPLEAQKKGAEIALFRHFWTTWCLQSQTKASCLELVSRQKVYKLVRRAHLRN